MLTRLQLLTYALDQAQLDSSYLPQARLWLNHYIEKQARNFDWPWFRVVSSAVTMTPGTLSYSLASNYGRSDTLYLYQNAQRVKQVFIVEPSLFDQYNNNVNSAGFPEVAYIQAASPIFDVSGNQIKTLVFNQAPNNSNISFVHTWFRRPVFLATTGAQATTDDALVPDFEDQDMLLQEMMKVAFQNIDDDRQVSQMQISMQAAKEAKINAADQDDNSVVELATSVFRSARGRRGSWMGP